MPLAPDTPFGQVPDNGQPMPYCWALDARCACRSKLIPLPLLRTRHGPQATAPAILARMRCSYCGERPRDAAWMRVVSLGEGSQKRVEERVTVRT